MYLNRHNLLKMNKKKEGILGALDQDEVADNQVEGRNEYIQQYISSVNPKSALQGNQDGLPAPYKSTGTINKSTNRSLSNKKGARKVSQMLSQSSLPQIKSNRQSENSLISDTSLVSGSQYENDYYSKKSKGKNRGTTLDLLSQGEKKSYYSSQSSINPIQKKKIVQRD